MTPNTPKSMKRTGLSGLILFAMLFLARPAAGQDFNYSVQHDSVVWQELNSLTLLNTINSPWDYTYNVSIGFSFHFLGQSFDTVSIGSNGSLSFDSEKRYSIIAYNGFGNVQDSSGNWSILGYNLSGDSGQRVLRIQYKNVANTSNPAEFLSYQIALFETGKIEIIAGEISPALLALNLQSYCTIGLINLQMDTPICGLFVGESYNQTSITNADPSIPQIQLLPNTGNRFRFIPNP